MSSTGSRVNLLLLSGPVAVGKSSVAAALIEEFGFKTIKTSAYLIDLANQRRIESTRTELQKLGDSLDEQTDYRWVVDNVAIPALAQSPSSNLWLFDSVRKCRQVQHFRERFGHQVLHVHLVASEAVLEQRYAARLTARRDYSGNTPYQVAVAHPNEVSARHLVQIADRTIDVSSISPQAAAIDIVRYALSEGAS